MSTRPEAAGRGVEGGGDVIRRATTDADIQGCWPLFRVLRPHLVEGELVARVRRQASEYGYELVWVEEDGLPVALAGYRVMEFLAWGRVLYVDDLVTDEARRGRGHGGRLLDWLLEEARRRDCAELHLDSGVHRFAAHRVYHSRRLEISSHHFSRRLRP
jgi:GNAT superfamily N-acetyltransferase